MNYIAEAFEQVIAGALVYSGGIDCSTNPNYPAANSGAMYKITVAGKIGGASGPNVSIGDVIICFVDGSAAGTHAAVGANWNIFAANVIKTDTSADATLSGTPIIITVYDAASNTPYYFKAYPTK